MDLLTNRIWLELIFYLKGAFHIDRKSATEMPLSDGSSRFLVRSLYRSMLIAIVGLSLGMRGLRGFVVCFVIFPPTTISQARLEEGTKKFPDE
jgi:hypothetical protein